MTNLNSIWEFEMTAAIANLHASRVFTCFAHTYSSPLSYSFLGIYINRIQNYPFLDVFWVCYVHLSNEEHQRTSIFLDPYSQKNYSRYNDSRTSKLDVKYCMINIEYHSSKFTAQVLLYILTTSSSNSNPYRLGVT